MAEQRSGPADRTSTRSLLVRARFGLPLAADGDQSTLRELNQRATRAARLIDRATPPGGIGLITGPSGSGKSMALASLAEKTEAVSTDTNISALGVQHDRSADLAPIDLLSTIGPDGMTIDRSLALLASVGLGEARRMVTPASKLSEGERSRLHIALMLAEAHSTAHDIAADEFAAVLDSLTAASLARCLGRSLRTPTRFFAATARHEIARDLRPDAVLYLPLSGDPELHTQRPIPAANRSVNSQTKPAAKGRACRRRTIF